MENNANVSAAMAPRAHFARALFAANAPNPERAVAGRISYLMQHQPVKMPKNQLSPAAKTLCPLGPFCLPRQVAPHWGNGKGGAVIFSSSVKSLARQASKR
jgi:hypothetical protein